MDNTQPDQKIKAYFNSRTIQPSQASWDRIDAMLETKNSPQRLWSPSLRKIAVIVILFCSVAGIINVYFTKFSGDNNLAVKKENHSSKEYALQKEKQNRAVENVTSGSTLETKTFTDNKSETSATLLHLGRHNHKNNVTNHHDYIGSTPITISDIQKDTAISAGEGAYGNTSDGLITKNAFRISADELLMTVDADIAKTKKLAIHQEIIKKYHLHPNDLLREAEEKAAQSFMAKVWKNIQDKSEIVITAVSERNQAK